MESIKEIWTDITRSDANYFEISNGRFINSGIHSSYDLDRIRWTKSYEQYFMIHIIWIGRIPRNFKIFISHKNDNKDDFRFLNVAGNHRNRHFQKISKIHI